MPHALPAIPFLAEFVLVLGAAVVVLLASHAIRLPPVVGFLLTGLLIGPGGGLGLVTDLTLIEAFAEIGVVFLLFSVGLEFSLQRLREVGRGFFLGGSLQTALTIVAAALTAVVFGAQPRLAIFLGFLVALSSTAIVLKLYAERRELEAPHGKLVIGILLFQDFLLVPLMIVTPVLAGGVEASVGSVVGRVGIGLLVVATVFGVARTLMPRILYAVVRTGIRELLVLGALVVGLGMALLTESFGFSLALGAFLAGILIAECVYSPQVVAEVAPFRDVFTSLFFISIGMLLDIDAALASIGTVAALAGGVFLGKALIVGAVVLAIGFPLRTAALVALALAQVGEFSFVLARVGLESELLGPAAYQTFLAASILTMMATPFLIRGGPAIAALLQRLPIGRAPAAPVPGRPSEGHVIVVGFGVNGQNLAKVLKSVRIPYVVLELNAEAVRRAHEAGEPVVYGDVTRVDVLDTCGIERAEVLVLAIADDDAVRRAVALARQMHPRIHVIVRTRHVAGIDSILQAGANEVVAEEFETSIEIFTRVLERFRVAPNVIEAQAKILRGDAYGKMRDRFGAGRISEAVLEILTAGTTAVFAVRTESAAAGRTLAELDLRRRVGVTVLAVVRGETPHPNPDPDFALAAGDALVLVGNHAEIRRAFADLEQGAEAPPAGD